MIFNKYSNSILAFILLFTLVFGSIATPQTASADPSSIIYASPNGSGSICTLAAPCSLSGARDLVRTLNQAMTDDIVIYLRGGTYTLTQHLS